MCKHPAPSPFNPPPHFWRRLDQALILAMLKHRVGKGGWDRALALEYVKDRMESTMRNCGLTPSFYNLDVIADQWMRKNRWKIPRFPNYPF